MRICSLSSPPCMVQTGRTEMVTCLSGSAPCPKMAAAAPQINLNLFNPFRPSAPIDGPFAAITATESAPTDVAVAAAASHNHDFDFDEARSEDAHFDVKGQGTVSVVVNQAGLSQFEIILSSCNDPHKFGSIGLTINQTTVSLWADYPNAGDLHVELKQSSEPGHALDAADKNIPYWLSFDANNQRLRYGKGEMMVTNMIFEYSWKPKPNEPVDETIDSLCKILNHVTVNGPEDDNMEIQCLRTGVNVRPSTILKSPDDMTLDLIAKNEATVASDLPFAGFQLYNNVAGQKMTLDGPDFPDFSAAMQHSFDDPAGICAKELATKKPGFGYLRITLGGNQGNSPGQPYVMELWPSHNGSPIHNHGKANAVIKVLHGSLTVNWYAGLAPGQQQPWGNTIVSKDDVTFLTPQYYQIHRLFNHTDTFAATIQCYRYDAEDNAHYEYFDWINEDKKLIAHFEPDSDFDFIEFKDKIRAEWQTYLDSLKIKSKGAAAAAQPPAKRARTNGTHPAASLKRSANGAVAVVAE